VLRLRDQPKAAPTVADMTIRAAMAGETRSCPLDAPSFMRSYKSRSLAQTTLFGATQATTSRCKKFGFSRANSTWLFSSRSNVVADVVVDHGTTVRLAFEEARPARSRRRADQALLVAKCGRARRGHSGASQISRVDTSRLPISRGARPRF